LKNSLSPRRERKKETYNVEYEEKTLRYQKRFKRQDVISTRAVGEWLWKLFIIN